MDLIEGYESSSSCSDSDKCELGKRQIRKVYLVTYSQANTSKFPTRAAFAQAVNKSFHKRSAKILQWCCSQEYHKTSGVHYHMCLKLSKNQRWLSAKKCLADEYGISVHFSSVHANYYTAWKYVTKEDKHSLESEGHPDLNDSEEPSTMRASEANYKSTAVRRRSHENIEQDVDIDCSDECGQVQHESELKKPTKTKKRKRLSAYEVSEIVLRKGLKNRTELLAFSNRQREEGKTDLAEFIVNRGKKVVSEVIATAWEMESAQKTQDRQCKTRIEILSEAHEGQCTCNAKAEWHSCALQLLANNNIAVDNFANCVKQLLIKGRGKFRNIMLTGPANCGKTFLLNPLNKIFSTFTNPASTSFAWVGAEKAEVLFLNDFRWSPQIIAWHDLLLMLEGQLVHLPAPKSHFAHDLVFDKDTPIFSTSKHQLVYVKGGVVDERETEMMAVRWKIFNFNRQILQEEQRDIDPCPACFARFILESYDWLD